MSWKNVIGQQRVKSLLQRALEKGELAHAYLFHGIEGVGKDAVAIELARVLNCREKKSEACDRCESCLKVDSLLHPNIHLICELPVGKGETKDEGPLDKLSEDQVKGVREQISQKAKDPYYRIQLPKANFIKINSIREIRRTASLSSFTEGKKVFIVMNAEDMNAEASNSLLKTLEEPPGNTILILTTSQRAKLLPTIVSRCQPVQFDPLGEDEIREALISREGTEATQASIVARLADGNYSVARGLLSRDLVQERQEVVGFLREVLGAQKLSLSGTIDRLASSYDRTSLERWLKMLQSWLRDALVLSENGRGAGAALTQNNDVKSFVEKFPKANLITALDAVERSIVLLSKNAYLPLVLTNLSIDLKKYLSPPAS